MSFGCKIFFDNPESVERAAWMLRGKLAEDGRIVEVPEYNCDTLTLDLIASLVGSDWNWIEDVIEDSEETTESTHEPGEASQTALFERRERLGRLVTQSAELLERARQTEERLASSPLSSVTEPTVGETNQQKFERMIAEGYRHLSQENLAEIDLSNRSLSNIDFNKADLSKANFENTSLSGCSFEQANLRGANFKNAQMPGTVLSSAVLAEANFEGANLCAAQLDWTNLQESILCRAGLSHANLESSNLTGADCSGADFSDAKLTYAKLQQATCIQALFQRTELTGANLQLANLAGAIFNRAMLGFASLYAAKSFMPRLQRHVHYFETEMPDGKTRGRIKSRSADDWEQLGLIAFAWLIGVVSVGYAAVTLFQEYHPFQTADSQPVKVLQSKKGDYKTKESQNVPVRNR